MAKSLVEEASKIIWKDFHDLWDIKRLQQIKREMSKLYDSYLEQWAIREENYESSRWANFIQVKKERRWDWKFFTDREADRIAKDRSEKKRWDFRTHKANWFWMKAMMDSIQSFCVSYRASTKHEWEASQHATTA